MHDDRKLAIARGKSGAIRRAETMDFIAANNLQVEPFGGRGAVRIHGRGVDFLAANGLRYVTPIDLRPLQ